MIEIAHRHPSSAPARRILVVGVGNAGLNALDWMAIEGSVPPESLIAAHTDAQFLTACVAGKKIQLGLEIARGFGSGGDPEVGRCAAEEVAPELLAAVEGADAVFILAGLGGGTGSGAAPQVAELARATGALVIAVATLPFTFEGKRRTEQAMEALAELQRHADAVICFENDRMSEAAAPRSSVQNAFAAADQTVAQAVQALSALLGRAGLIRLGYDELAALLLDANPRCLFGHGEATGDNRPFEALAAALRNPLMDKGRLLRESEAVLVQVSGGPDLLLDELHIVMEAFNHYIGDRTRVFFGAAIDPALSGKLTVTILSSIGDAPAAVTRTRPRPVARQVEPQAEQPMLASVEELAPVEEPAEPQPEPQRQPVSPTPAELPTTEPAPLHAAVTEAPEAAPPALSDLFGNPVRPETLPVGNSNDEANEAEAGSDPAAETDAARELRLLETDAAKPPGLRTPSRQASLFGADEPTHENPAPQQKQPATPVAAPAPPTGPAAPTGEPSSTASPKPAPTALAKPAPLTTPAAPASSPLTPNGNAKPKPASPFAFPLTSKTNAATPSATPGGKPRPPLFNPVVPPPVRATNPFKPSPPAPARPLKPAFPKAAPLPEPEAELERELTKTQPVSLPGGPRSTPPPAQPLPEKAQSPRPPERPTPRRDEPPEPPEKPRRPVARPSASASAGMAGSHDAEPHATSPANAEISKPRSGEAARPGAAGRGSKKPKPPQQELPLFDTAAKGRFEKSDPTIIDGEDLDVPTYLRRRVKLR